jgi:hypothetical protein
MLTQSIWWATATVEVLLLARGLQAKWVSRYPVFFGYIFFVLVQSLVRHSFYGWNATLYYDVYWITEFLAILIGSAVVFEIYSIGLAAFPGTARMARNVLALVFILACTKTGVDAWNDPHWLPAASVVDIERYLRIFQVVSTGALIALFLFYSVPFGKNLKGILIGYMSFVSLAVMWLKVAPFAGNTLLAYWAHILPASYLGAVCVWTVYLWSYQPQPAPRPEVHLEQDYQKIAAATRRRLQEARGYLGKATPL